MNKKVIEKLYYKNDIDTFFNCDFEDALKPNSKHSKNIELNFGKDEIKNNICEEVYKNITAIIFEDNKMSLYHRGMWKYTNDFIMVFEMIFNKKNLSCTRDKIIVSFNNINDIFHKLNLFLSVIKDCDNLILKNGTKTETNKEIVKVEINSTKLNYSINEIGITNKNTILLMISYDSNNDITFLKEINNFRNLDNVIAQNGNRIEFNEDTTIGNVLEILNKYGWTTEYNEEELNEYEWTTEYNEEDNKINNINLDLIVDLNLDNYSKLIQTIINGYDKNMNIAILRELLSVLLWKWTERNGKLLGCEIWSKKAIELYKHTNKITKINSVLVHEHIIPKKVLIDQMLKNSTIDNIKKILVNSKAAVILKEEDKKLNNNNLRENMPEYLHGKLVSDYSNKDIFSRYKNADIQLYNVEWDNKFIKNSLIIEI